MTNERLWIMSEINELELLIAMTPDEHIIDKKSLESRLRKVKRELEKLPESEDTPK